MTVIVVTLQHLSYLDPFYDIYEPHLSRLAEYVRGFSPKAKILLYQTWTYEEGSQRLNEELGIADLHEMLEKITVANEKAARKYQLTELFRAA